MPRPNILFLLADDLGWADLSFHGSPIRTPHIDGLAATGLELTQHYVCPMCTPTRASLLTGRHPGRFGAHATVPSNAPVLPDGYQTLATVLKQAGYDTGLFGKWHLGSEPRFGPNQYGFDRAYGSLAGGVDPYSHRYKRSDYSLTWHRDGELVEDRGHVTDLIAEEACAWIESRDQPWFCYVPFTAVHVPVKPTQEWLGRYFFEQFDDDPLKDASYKKYAAYTSHMDQAVGRLLESLERSGQRQDTLVVFSSDNGAINDCPLHGSDKYPGWQEAYPRLGSNGPYRGVKAQLYEGGIRTPTVVNWNSHLVPGKRHQSCQIVDWMPTLIGLVGGEPQVEPHWDGVDIWPLLSGDQTEPPRTHYWNFRGGRNLGLRHGPHKLISTAAEEGRRLELFDIEQDPYEKREIGQEHPDIVRELSAMIEEEGQRDGTAARPEVKGPGVS
ncbi:MAG: sulfatase-like hydrolase/transferase [Candidatus Latescibacteria bacterium]|nr:sulfatase-like hydrolase/transferase [Candidatus Latescibacterota bacterium]